MLYIKRFIEREKNTGQSAPECPFKTGGMGRSRSMKKAPCDRSYTTFYWSAIISIAVCCTIFELFYVE